MSVFRTTRNLLIVYPFFWGVGACWDVLVHFGTAPDLTTGPEYGTMETEIVT